MTNHSDSEKAAVVAQELALHRSDVRTDAKVLQKLLHPEFVELGSSGARWTLPAIIDELSTEDKTSIAVSDMQCTGLADEVMLVTYEALNEGKRSLRSSVWIRTERGWQMRFHQGTRAK